MNRNLKNPEKYNVLKIIAIYAIFSSLWIYFSDTVLGFFINDQATLIRISLFKGFLFVTITSILLYQLVSRYLLESRELKEVVKKNEQLFSLLAERTADLEKKRIELEMQNEELRETSQALTEETAALLRAMEDLREKEQLVIQQNRMAAMGEMLGNIAHQWRQPFNTLGLMVQDLGLSYESGGFSKELLDNNIGKVMEILLHLSQTIDDFSNFATPDKEMTLFNVDQVIVKTISLIKESFKNNHIAIDISSSDDPQINGYPHEYAQALLNILMNARDAFLESRKDNARIIVRSWVENGRSVVTITDNAGGIKANILGKIFEPYFTTKDLGKGTGVGLFLSKTIIEKNMRGRLSARNTGDGVELRIEV
jgi:signal transduction histidine kinase